MTTPFFDSRICALVLLNYLNETNSDSFSDYKFHTVYQRYVNQTTSAGSQELPIDPQIVRDKMIDLGFIDLSNKIFVIPNRNEEYLQTVYS